MIIAQLIVDLLEATAKLVTARGDTAKEEEAMMLADEALKRAADKRKFGSDGT